MKGVDDTEKNNWYKYVKFQITQNSEYLQF